MQEDGHGTAQGMTEHRLEPAAASGCDTARLQSGKPLASPLQTRSPFRVAPDESDRFPSPVHVHAGRLPDHLHRFRFPTFPYQVTHSGQNVRGEEGS